MSQIERISYISLKKILSGKIKKNVYAVVKFYSPDCPMCHAYAPDFEQVATWYRDIEEIRFFAYSILDGPDVSAALGFEGTPSIGIQLSGPALTKSAPMEFVADPDSPHPDKWFFNEGVIESIERYITRYGARKKEEDESAPDEDLPMRDLFNNKKKAAER